MAFITILCIVFSFSCFAVDFSVMQYNVENFFDTQHDEGTDDWTYLPKEVKQSSPEAMEYCESLKNPHYASECRNIDWNEQVLTHKIANISRVIKSFDEKSEQGPDVLVLEEVENIHVLDLLVKEGLDGLGYGHRVLIEGDDSRGIDVAILSKYPIASAKRHSIFVKGRKLDTRGILEVELRVGKQKVAIFGNHWPSQGNPASHRVASAQLLADLANRQSSETVLALGDFNTLSSDVPYPYDSLSQFTDVESEARKLKQRDLNPGTHYYNGTWSSLDKIFVLKRSKATIHFDTYQIIHHPFMLRPDGKKGQMVPLRFDSQSGQGFSDHLPVSVEISL